MIFAFKLEAEELFQNKFFLPSTDESIPCSTSEEQFLSRTQLQQILNFYEKGNPTLRERAVEFLTNYTNPVHKEWIKGLYQICQSTSEQVDLCVLSYNFKSRENALRVLALFYDTQITIERGNDEKHLTFTTSQLRLIEKAVRKIPLHLRQKIASMKSDSKFDNLWEGRKALTFDPQDGKGLFGGAVIGQVIKGDNTIGLSMDGIDHALEGKMYDDINRFFLVDFRIHHVVHEIGHVVDLLFSLAYEQSTGPFGFNTRALNKDSIFRKFSITEPIAIWPSNWWDTADMSPIVKDGRYLGDIANGNFAEVFAEGFSQYILFPEGLQKSAPNVYDWYKKSVFMDIEYRGYGICQNPVARPLTRYERFMAPNLHRH